MTCPAPELTGSHCWTGGDQNWVKSTCLILCITHRTAPNHWGTKPPGVSCWVWVGYRIGLVLARPVGGFVMFMSLYVLLLSCPAEGGCYLWAVLLSVGVCFVRRGVWLGGKTCRDRGFPAELSTGTQWWLLFTSPVNDFIIVADWALINVSYMLHRLFPLNEPLRHQEER